MPDTPIVFVPPTSRESELDDLFNEYLLALDEREMPHNLDDDAFNEYLLALDEWKMPHNLDDARAAWERRQA